MAILKQGATIGVAVHHSVYKPANNIADLRVQAGLFDSWHKSKSWAEDIKTGGEYGYQYIEYHYLMATDGSILQVQDEKYVLYHSGDNFRGNLSLNLHGIAICLTGNYENDVPTEEQMKSLVSFIRDIQKRYNIDAVVRGHKETSQTATACPGRNVGTSKGGWLKQVIINVNNKDYPPAPVVPPVQTECEKEVERLQGEIDHLSVAIGALEVDKKLALDRVEFLEGSLKLCEVENKELNISLTNVLKERDRFEREKLLAVEELSKIRAEQEKMFWNILKEKLETLYEGLVKLFNGLTHKK